MIYKSTKKIIFLFLGLFLSFGQSISMNRCTYGKVRRKFFSGIERCFSLNIDKTDDCINSVFSTIGSCVDDDKKVKHICECIIDELGSVKKDFCLMDAYEEILSAKDNISKKFLRSFKNLINTPSGFVHCMKDSNYNTINTVIDVTVVATIILISYRVLRRCLRN